MQGVKMTNKLLFLILIISQTDVKMRFSSTSSVGEGDMVAGKPRQQPLSTILV